MAAKLRLDEMQHEIADRAKAVFGGVVNDLDRLFKKLGDRIGNGSAPPRAELLKLIRALRKSLDMRLAALERVVAGGAKKGVRKGVRKGAPAAKKKAPARRAVKKATTRRRR